MLGVIILWLLAVVLGVVLFPIPAIVALFARWKTRKQTKMSNTRSHLKSLDYLSCSNACIGACVCRRPTYDATKLERNSPRGRIALMRAVADDRLDVTRRSATKCISARAVCVSDGVRQVNYAELFEHARAEIEEKKVLANPKRNLIRGFTVSWLFMDLRRLELFLAKGCGFISRLDCKTSSGTAA